MSALKQCLCCGGRDLAFVPVLSVDLISQWELAPHEVAYVDRQQGLHCTGCGSNLRAMALARAIVRTFAATSATLEDFVETERARQLRVLELNEAGTLTRWLARLPMHTIARFPAVDMTALPYETGCFDLVCHSDTLEHVTDPLAGLRECRRVLEPHGAVAFTVPIVVARLSRRRDGLPASYHLGSNEDLEQVRVRTEYGADAWLQLIEAGFDECRIHALDPPAAHALVGIVRD